MARESVAVATRSPATADAKLALLEELQRCTDATAAAQTAADWLVAHTDAEKTIFAAPDHMRGTLDCVAGAGFSPRQLKRFCLSLDDPTHPLVNALTNGSVVSFHGARDSRLRLSGNEPFTAVKVGRSEEEPALGLILIGPALEPPHTTVRWVADSLARSLGRLVTREGLLEEDPRLRREHALLFNIINAATDPIMFTNMDGQLIIANARAELLFTAPDDVSEGRRRAVQLNNMFFLGGAVAHHAGRRGSRTPRAAAGRSHGRLRPAVRAAQHGGQRSARRHRHRLDSQEHHRPSAGHPADRRELREACAPRKAKCAPSAIG